MEHERSERVLNPATEGKEAIFARCDVNEKQDKVVGVKNLVELRNYRNSDFVVVLSLVYN